MAPSSEELARTFWIRAGCPSTSFAGPPPPGLGSRRARRVTTTRNTSSGAMRKRSHRAEEQAISGEGPGLRPALEQISRNRRRGEQDQGGDRHILLIGLRARVAAIQEDRDDMARGEGGGTGGERNLEHHVSRRPE